MEREANAERSSNGGSLFNRLANGFALPGFREARAKQIVALNAEIRALEMVNDALFFDLHEVNLQRERAKMLRTPYGRFLEMCGVAMAVVCGWRFVTGLKRLIFKQTPKSDPISFALHLFLANKSVHVDPAVLAQYLSLLLIAFLVINSMQTFILQLVRLFFAVGTGVTTDALVLMTTEMVGLYFLSTVLLVREQLPEEYRAIITEALGADLEFRFYAKFYELIFMASAALTVISLYAKHVTAASTDDVGGRSASVSAFAHGRQSELKLS
ncbi:Abscisic acid G-protein coupled receptor-domain-containing protein [Ostreococcus tauri]|uniref:Abscisic acid G-protein coupled receptor-domain-containing protein n=1 Tax=Ostreococcus tauri TaxID=70448 RepID=A0A1Y5ILX9_OSTTA|nr:Abscisic acid G-protein coupled receptor-domain-containing protein [Ostreococcus tauri]